MQPRRIQGPSPDLSGQILAPLIHGIMEQPAQSSPPKGRSKLIRPRPASWGAEDVRKVSDGALQRYTELTKLLKAYRQDGDVLPIRRHVREYGVPGNLRGAVWPILLAHHPYVLHRSIMAQYPTSASSLSSGPVFAGPRVPIKRIRGELSRHHRQLHHRRYLRSPSTTSSSPSGSEKSSPPDANIALEVAAHDAAVERALVSFLSNHSEIEFSIGMVHVCLTLAQWLLLPPVNPDDSEPVDDVLSICFEQIMYIMLWTPTPTAPVGPVDDMSTQHISDFLTAFRKLMPDLAAHFTKEDVGSWGDEWVFTWIQWWCARELGKEEKGRLWDWYLAWEEDEPEGPNGWHLYVCLALLRYCRDALEELETSEIRTLLSQLPAIEHMEFVIEEAKNIQRELKELDQKEEAAVTSSSTNSVSVFLR